jgi:hypothetical protein
LEVALEAENSAQRAEYGARDNVMDPGGIQLVSKINDISGHLKG